MLYMTTLIGATTSSSSLRVDLPGDLPSISHLSPPRIYQKHQHEVPLTKYPSSSGPVSFRNKHAAERLSLTNAGRARAEVVE
jgi:hypothetical protein